MKLLIAEDEVKLNKGLAKGLRDMGFAVDSAFDGEEGEKILSEMYSRCTLGFRALSASLR